MALDEEDEEARRVCSECIGNQTYANWIKDNGKRGQCDFSRSHGRTYTAVSIASFAEHVDKWFRENYDRGDEYPIFEGESDSPTYQTYGEPYKDIMLNELECDDAIIDALSEKLPDADWHDISQGDYAFYDDTANYESRDSANRRSQQEEEEYWYEHRISYQWNDFCRGVQYEKRFFRTKEKLDGLFGEPKEYYSGKTTPLYTLKKGATIYRARLLDDDFTEQHLESDPAIALGAPPQNKAPAGRMNVELIPAFYGAFSEKTAIAEIRPSIGDKIAIGQFSLLKDLRVFDFTAFSSNRKDDPEIYSHTRYDFISQMEEEIGKPILPYEKQREYIATQIVAEYLREYFDCDAVIYRSSMHKGREIENRNIVIFGQQIDFLGGGSRQILDFVRHKTRKVINVVFTTNDDHL